MKKLCLESNEDTSLLMLTGDIAAIFANRRASRYLKDTMQYSMSEDCLTIEVKDDINKAIDRIKKVCEYIKAELVFAETISEAVNNYALEEEKFREFSEKARSIRDNDCDANDFRSFLLPAVQLLPDFTVIWRIVCS